MNFLPLHHRVVVISQPILPWVLVESSNFMTVAIPEFVSELYRSANEISKVSAFERRRLVERAARTIAEQRTLLSAAGNVVSMPSGVIAGLDPLLSQLDDMPDQLMSHILLECADEIRKLHMLGVNIA